MSGPITAPNGVSDGITWTVRDDLGDAMVSPATPHATSLTPPSYYGGPLPYYGDFQISIEGALNKPFLVIEFSKPVKQIRTTAQFVAADGMAMHAVLDISHVNLDGTFTGVDFVFWDQFTSGTRTLTYEPGFKVVILETPIIDIATNGVVDFTVTFRNTFFFENLPVVAPVVEPEPDLRVPRGSGRLLSLTFPPLASPGVPNPQSLAIRPRSVASEVHIVPTNIGTPPSGNGTNMVYRGMRCLRMNGGNAAGTLFRPSQLTNRRLQMYPALERMVKANLDGLDEMACWRLYALLAFQQPGGPITADAGLVIAPGNNTIVRSAPTAAGMSLGLRDIDTLGFSTRAVGGGAIVDHVLTLPTGFDIEDWHTYELRLLSATSSAEATLKVLIDDDLMYQSQWGAGTELPDMLANNLLGFTWAVSNLGGSPDFTTTMYLALGGVEFACSMTEDGLR